MLSGVPPGADAVLAAAEILPYGVAIADLNGILTWVNAAYARLSGFQPEELLGQPAGDFPFQELMHAEPAAHKPGGDYAAKHTITVLRSPAGEPTGFCITKEDTAGLRPAAEALSMAANLSALIESTDDLIFSFDLDYKLLAFNRPVFEYMRDNFGVRVEIGRGLELLPPEKAALWPPLCERALSQGPFRIEYPLVDGKILELSLNPIRQEGRAVGISVFGKDITERQRAEAKLKQANEAVAKAEQHYRLIFNSGSDAIFVHQIGEDGLPSRIVEVNDNACRYLGYTRDELLRMRVFDIAAPETHANVKAITQRILSDGHWVWEGTHISKSGRRIPVEINTQRFDLDGLLLVISSVRDISDRHKAEKQYREIFDGALEGIYRTTLEGRNLATNPALANMLGYGSPDEMVATIKDAARQVWVNPDERAEFMRLLTASGVIRGYECQYKRKDGTTIWVSLSSRVVYDADGQPLYTEGFIEDITERKRMQDALRKSEDKLAKIFLSSPTVTILFQPVDGGYRIADVNEAFEHTSGYRREEVIGRTTRELELWPDPEEFDEFLRRFRANGSVRSFEHRFRRKNGEVGVCLSSAESIEIDGLPCAIAATIDITQQKQVEETMRSLVTAIEQSADTVVITDLNGVIQYCNPAFEKVTGYSKEEAIGQNPRVLKSGKHDAEFYRQMWATIVRGQVWSGHLTNKKKDGSLYQESATITPIRDASGKTSGFVAVKRDITRQRELEDQLRHAQKMESVGRLAGGVAHDFNNLLTVINGYGGLLLKRLKPSDPLREYAEHITKAGERAVSLTKQLLAFSRKQVIEPKVLDLNKTIRESAPVLQRLIGEDIALTTHLDGALGQVMADPEQIHQVIMNLVVNARDAMPDGGRLDIETSNVEIAAEAGNAMNADAIPGRYVSMSVTDSGHGMDEITRQNIFEPFFTTKEVGKGTGLGLSTVYGIVQQSGGWIDVWSAAGVGTSMKVYLPRIDSFPAPEPEKISPPPQPGDETILVVEDQSSVRAFAVAALQECGYHVLEASNGDEAISIANQHPGQIQLLLTDVVMPGMNGKVLSQRLKRSFGNLKVLFMSGYTADAFAERGVLDRGVAFLHKPFTPHELAAKVREVLASTALGE
jgi:PAS domain S-box-containing protein